MDGALAAPRATDEPRGRAWTRASVVDGLLIPLGLFVLAWIVYAWVNDENTLRKAGSRTDPYAVFARRLDEGNPPDSWEDLLADARRRPRNQAR